MKEVHYVSAMINFFICPTFLSLELCLDGLLVNATCVLISEIPPEAGGRTEGKRALQARAAHAMVTPGASSNGHMGRKAGE